MREHFLVHVLLQLTLLTMNRELACGLEGKSIVVSIIMGQAAPETKVTMLLV